MGKVRGWLPEGLSPPLRGLSYLSVGDERQGVRHRTGHYAATVPLSDPIPEDLFRSSPITQPQLRATRSSKVAGGPNLVLDRHCFSTDSVLALLKELRIGLDFLHSFRWPATLARSSPFRKPLTEASPTGLTRPHPPATLPVPARHRTRRPGRSSQHRQLPGYFKGGPARPLLRAGTSERNTPPVRGGHRLQGCHEPLPTGVLYRWQRDVLVG